MTRKITLAVILIILVIGCYQVIFGKTEMIRKHVMGVNELKSASEKLNTELESISNEEFETKKEQLKKVIKDYKNTKEEYEQIVSQFSAETTQALLAVQENELKDIYDVDFLWTIIGNYATQEGVKIKFDINKNISSASSIANTSNNYIVCDLKFTIIGNYINLTDFIYDLEDDDRLNFEINDFNMQKEGEDLQVTLTVKEIKINTDTLIQSAYNDIRPAQNNQTTNTQTVDSNTTSNATSVNNVN